MSITLISESMIMGLWLLEHNPGSIYSIKYSIKYLSKYSSKYLGLDQILDQMLEHSLVSLLREAAAARPLPITPSRQSGCGAAP